MKKVKLYMGLPSTGLRSDSQTYALRRMEKKYGDRIEFIYPDLCVHRTFHDFARNGIVDEFLLTDADILWFLDSDICPPTHVLDLITEHGDKWLAAGAVYPIFMVAPGAKDASVLFTGYKGVVSDKGITLASIPHKGTDWLDALATGCLFLKRELFAKLEKPYFEFKYDHESRRMTEGEDLGFALKLHKLGIQFFTDYGMVCKHYKTVDLLDIQNYATDMSNMKVMDYDKEIRASINGALAAAKQLAFKEGYEAGMHEAANRERPRGSLILPENFRT